MFQVIFENAHAEMPGLFLSGLLCPPHLNFHSSEDASTRVDLCKVILNTSGSFSLRESSCRQYRGQSATSNKIFHMMLEEEIMQYEDELPT